MSKIKLLSGQKQKGESQKAILACNDFLRMGGGRKLAILMRKYIEMQEILPPTRSVHTLGQWSSRFDWPARAIEYDVITEKEKTAFADRMMREGLALDYERVERLNKLFDLLFKELFEKGEEGELINLWLPDVKSIGSGEFAERVDIERYNSPIISDIRGILDDLAKETGGRTKNVDLTSKGDKIAIIGFDPDKV